MKTEHIEHALKLARIAVDAIRESGADGMPAGHLYATMMTAGMTLETFNSMIALLKRSNLVSESYNNVLRYIQ